MITKQIPETINGNFFFTTVMRQLYTSAILFIFGNTPFYTSVVPIYTEVISGLTSNISGLTSNISGLTSNISLRTSNVPPLRIKIPLYMLASV